MNSGWTQTESMTAVQWTTVSACRMDHAFMTGHMQAGIRVLLHTVSFTPHWISRSGSLMRDSEESQWNYITHDSMHRTRHTKRIWSSYLFIKRDVKQKHMKATLYRSIMYITLQPMKLMHTAYLLIMAYNWFKGKDPFNVFMIFLYFLCEV